MKTISKYQQAKTSLKNIANDCKENFKNDKPAMRQLINDSVDTCSGWYSLSEHQRNLLSNYACKLHPKD
jgi:hypothetical protein